MHHKFECCPSAIEAYPSYLARARYPGRYAYAALHAHAPSLLSTAELGPRSALAGRPYKTTQSKVANEASLASIGS